MKFQRGGFAIGLVVGLLIGLALALGVALYITKAPVPFINKVPQRTADQDAAEPAFHPVVIVGAGPVGLSLAIDLAQRGQHVLLLDNDQRLSTGSRAICFAKRTLEIGDSLGGGDALCAKGV